MSRILFLDLDGTVRRFQSPYGDYLVRNETKIIIKPDAFYVSVPLRGLLS